MSRQDKQILKRIAGVLAAVLFVGWFLFWPLNYYIETPGTADNLKSYVTVKGHPDKHKGSYMITSVYLQQARPATYIWAHFDPQATIEKASDVTGGQSGATYNKVQNFYMKSAINEAIAVAYKAAHQEYTKQYLGIYVLEVEKQSKFKNDLKVGDTITEVDGRHFDTAQGYQKYIANQKVGQDLTITYLHNGKKHQTTHKLIKIMGDRAGIGILLTDNVKIHTKIPVTVGEIGGIDKKVIAAHKAGATIFFAPYVKPTKTILKYEEGHQTNYQLAKKTAKKYAPGMKVVPVKSFNNAVEYLRTHQ